MAFFSERLRRNAWGLAFIALGTGDFATNAAMLVLVDTLSSEDILTVALFMALGTVYNVFGAWILTANGKWRSARTVSFWGAALAWAIAGGLLLFIEGGWPGTHDPLYRYVYGNKPADITYAIGTIVTILLALVMAILGYRKMTLAWRSTGFLENSRARK